jgi:hypothetical protein
VIHKGEKNINEEDKQEREAIWEGGKEGGDGGWKGGKEGEKQAGMQAGGEMSFNS